MNWLSKKFKDMDEDTFAACIIVPMMAICLLLVVLTMRSCEHYDKCTDVCQGMKEDQQRLECILQCDE